MRMRLSHLQPGRRGAVMVMTLWLIIVLMVMAYSLSYEMRLGLKSTSFAQRRLKAEAVARIGMARAVADLRNDRLLAFNNSNNYNDTLKDIWASDDEEHLDVEVGKDEGSYSVLVRDEDRKIDLNLLRAQGTGMLVALLDQLFRTPKKDAEVMANAIIDYRDNDLKANTGEGGFETEFYTEWGLRNAEGLPEGWVFRPRNDDFKNVDELLQIPGFTHEMLYGDPTEAERDPFEREHEHRRRKESVALVDYVTVGTGGGVNLNTADEVVLTALITGAGIPDSAADGFAKKIIQLRESSEHIKQNGVSGIVNPAQLREAGLDDQTLSALQAMYPLAVVSRIFVITARGDYEGVQRTIQARVNVSIESYQVDAREERRRGVRDQRGLAIIKNKPDLRVDPAVRVMWMNTVQ